MTAISVPLPKRVVTIPIRVSVASLWQRFHGCEPTFIRDVCKAKCCDAPTRPTGTLIVIHPSEQSAVEARGGRITDGLLESPDRVCPFKTEGHLCRLHETPDKPYGCVASPFTLNRADCLIVRNRYRMLPCYERAPGIEPHPAWPPAFEAFPEAIERIFGHVWATRLTGWLLTHGDPHAEDYDGPKSWEMPIPKHSYDILRWNDAAKRHG